MHDAIAHSEEFRKIRHDCPLSIVSSLVESASK